MKVLLYKTPEKFIVNNSCVYRALVETVHNNIVIMSY